MPCPNRYTSTAALWPLRIILALETVTISNFQQGERLSLAASLNRPSKVSRFSSDSCLAPPFPSILRFSSSCMVYTMDFVYGEFWKLELVGSFLVFFFRVKKRLEENKEFKEVFWERVFCLFVCMICMVFSRFLLLEEGEECSEKFSILSIALRSFSFFYIGRVLWIFIEMENIGKYKYKFWCVKFYIFLQLLIDIRYLYNYKFLLSL